MLLLSEVVSKPRRHVVQLRVTFLYSRSEWVNFHGRAVFPPAILMRSRMMVKWGITHRSEEHPNIGYSQLEHVTRQYY